MSGILKIRVMPAVFSFSKYFSEPDHKHLQLPSTDDLEYSKSFIPVIIEIIDLSSNIRKSCL